MSPYSHLILTRFSYRGPRTSKAFDPLDPALLSRRFDVFEATCLPSVLGQTCKDFSWVLIIDELLPPAFRMRLEQLVSGHEKTFLHCYSKDGMAALDWLAPYTEGRDHIVTTVLDDDDMLFDGFVERMQQHLMGLERGGGLPRFSLLGCKSALQWDWVTTRETPLGYVKPWQRRSSDGRYYPPSTGFSALSRYPEPNRSIFAFSHHLACFYFADDEALETLAAPTQARIRKLRASLKPSPSPTGDDAPSEEELAFHWIPGDEPQALITNHGVNTQLLRLFDESETRSKIDGAASLPGFSVDLSALSRYRENHPRQLSHYFRQLRHILWLKFSPDSPVSLTVAYRYRAKRVAARLRERFRVG